MVGLRPDDDFVPSRDLPRSLGAYKLSAGVEVYALGICAASVCSPAELAVGDLLLIVNQECPTGISSPWQLSDDDRFRTGQPNPTSCDRDPARIHRLLVC